MKAVLIPIQPLDCERISKRKKRVIITKRKPTLETPFKCYIFETRHGGHSCKNCNQKDDCYAYAPRAGCYNGCSKVIGEFVCDKIEEFKKGEKGVLFKRFEALYETCLTVNEMRAYMGNSDKVYGWHISDLKIYDEPKELSEFLKPCKWRVNHGFGYECEAPSHKVGCQYAFADRNPDWSVNSYMCGYKGYVTRPPQSWCYVEELE